MGRGIHIEVLSERKIWSRSFMLSAQALTQKISFFKQGQNADKVEALFIDAQGYSLRNIKRKIEKYHPLPVFIICEEGQKKNFVKIQNVIGVFSDEVTTHKLVETIKMSMDEADNLNADHLKAHYLDKGQLSLAEELVLEGLSKGYSNKQMARFYGINISKVKYHLQHLYQKLEVKNRVQAALIAQEIIV